jgi:glutamyl-tRNA synthetase
MHADGDWQADLCELIGPSLTLLADGVAQAEPFFTCPPLNEAAQAQVVSDGAQPALAALLSKLNDGPLDSDQAQALLGEAATDAGVKKGVIMKSLRAALLGSLQGPDLLATWLLLHRSGEDRARIQRSL